MFILNRRPATGNLIVGLYYSEVVDAVVWFVQQLTVVVPDVAQHNFYINRTELEDVVLLVLELGGSEDDLLEVLDLPEQFLHQLLCSCGFCLPGQDELNGVLDDLLLGPRILLVIFWENGSQCFNLLIEFVSSFLLVDFQHVNLRFGEILLFDFIRWFL